MQIQHYIDIVFDTTSAQIRTLKDLIKYNNYVKIQIGTHPSYVPDSPSENQIRKLLRMRTVV